MHQMHDWFSAHYEFLKDFAGPIVSLLGIVVASVAAILGFRSFERSKREQLEERRIDVALEGLAIARESKYVFARIRNPNGFEGEWHSMDIREGESESDRGRRGTTYAILVRLRTDRDFFDRVSRFLPKAVALFRDRIESVFERLQLAESLVRDAAVQLTWQLPVHPETPRKEDFERRMQLRSYLWAGVGSSDRVENELQAFCSETEALFRQIVRRESE